jgi:hypothetical protein
MFYDYDDTEKSFRITYSDGKVRDLTEQELYEFFVFTKNGITKSFVELLNDLRNGKIVHGEDYEFDYDLGADIYRGSLNVECIGKVQKYTQDYTSSKSSSSGQCSHSDKYVNSAGGIKFWVCRSCKKDLGDA